MTHRPAIFWRIALGLLAAVALAACGGGDGESSSNNGSSSNGGGDGNGASAGQTVTLVTKEFFFEPDSVSVPAGATEIVVDNTGGVVEHDFTLDELSVEIYAAPGSTESDVVQLDAGTYEFYCSIPGHREAGMEGTLTVS